MKDKDSNLLTEAYKKINETPVTKRRFPGAFAPRPINKNIQSRLLYTKWMPERGDKVQFADTPKNRQNEDAVEYIGQSAIVNSIDDTGLGLSLQDIGAWFDVDEIDFIVTPKPTRFSRSQGNNYENDYSA